MDQLENKIELLKHKKDDKEYNELVDLCFLLFNIILYYYLLFWI